MPLLTQKNLLSVDIQQLKTPANAVAGKKKKKDEVPDELKKVIMKRMSSKIKEDNDNNNVVLKGVLDKLDNIDHTVDKLSV